MSKFTKYYVETISTDIEHVFDDLVTKFINNHKVLSMDYQTTVALYNDTLQPYYIVHIKYSI